MTIIKKLAEMIDEELADARKYAECALKEKDEHPALAGIYNALSQDEMKHMNMLHGEVVKMIKEYRAKNGEPPAAMLAVWEYKHGEHIEEAEEIAVLQNMFAKM